MSNLPHCPSGECPLFPTIGTRTPNSYRTNLRAHWTIFSSKQPGLQPVDVSTRAPPTPDQRKKVQRRERVGEKWVLSLPLFSSTSERVGVPTKESHRQEDRYSTPLRPRRVLLDVYLGLCLGPRPLALSEWASYVTLTQKDPRDRPDRSQTEGGLSNFRRYGHVGFRFVSDRGADFGTKRGEERERQRQRERHVRSEHKVSCSYTSLVSKPLELYYRRVLSLLSLFLFSGDYVGLRDQWRKVVSPSVSGLRAYHPLRTTGSTWCFDSAPEPPQRVDRLSGTLHRGLKPFDCEEEAEQEYPLFTGDSTSLLTPRREGGWEAIWSASRVDTPDASTGATGNPQRSVSYPRRGRSVTTDTRGAISKGKRKKKQKTLFSSGQKIKMI